MGVKTQTFTANGISINKSTQKHNDTRPDEILYVVNLTSADRTSANLGLLWESRVGGSVWKSACAANM